MNIITLAFLTLLVPDKVRTEVFGQGEKGEKGERGENRGGKY